MPKVEKKKVFRVQYKQIGLTYSKCPIDKKLLMDTIMEKFEVLDYFAVQESHDPKKDGYDPQNPNHVHIWMELAMKPNITNCNAFDYLAGDKKYHCNIGKKNRSWINNYLRKQDKEPYTNIPEGFIGLALAGNYKGAIQRFRDTYPKEYAISMPRIHANLRALAAPLRESVIFPLSTKWTPPGYDWKTRSLLLIGPSDLGKTEYLKSYVHHALGKTFLFVNKLDRLKTYVDEDFIIYDEAYFPNLTREDVINLTDVPQPRDIACRNSDAHIPAGVPRLFSSNRQLEAIFRPECFEGIAIFPKRLHVLNFFQSDNEVIPQQQKGCAPSIRFY